MIIFYTFIGFLVGFIIYITEPLQIIYQCKNISNFLNKNRNYLSFGILKSII